MTTSNEGPKPAPERLRLILVDADEVVLEALAELFEGHPDFSLVKAVDSGVGALQALTDVQVDMALIDVDMPGLDGIETTRRIRKLLPEVTVVIYTNFEHEGSLDRAISVGARGFLTKDMPFDALTYGLKQIHAGTFVMGTRPMEILVDFFSNHPGKAELDFRQGLDQLPEHLMNVLDELIKGHPNKVIADRLGLADITVRGYVSNLLSRTGCKNRAELASRAARAVYRR